MTLVADGCQHDKNLDAIVETIAGRVNQRGMPIRWKNVKPCILGTSEHVTEQEHFTTRGGWNGHKGKKWPKRVNTTVGIGEEWKTEKRGGTVQSRVNVTRQLPML